MLLQTLTFGIGQNWDNIGAAQDDVIMVEKLEYSLSEIIRNLKWPAFHPLECKTGHQYAIVSQDSWATLAWSKGYKTVKISPL